MNSGSRPSLHQWNASELPQQVWSKGQTSRPAGLSGSNTSASTMFFWSPQSGGLKAVHYTEDSYISQGSLNKTNCVNSLSDPTVKNHNTATLITGLALRQSAIPISLCQLLLYCWQVDCWTAGLQPELNAGLLDSCAGQLNHCYAAGLHLGLGLMV